MAYLMFQCPTQGPIGDQVDLAPRESDLRAGLLYRSNGKKPLISDDSHHRVGANKGPVGKLEMSIVATNGFIKQRNKICLCNRRWFGS